MQSAELLLAPVRRSIKVVQGVGRTALEVVDNERLVRRLTREHQDHEMKQALRSFDTALYTQDVDMTRAQAITVARVIARGLITAAEIEQGRYADHINLLQTMFADHLPDEDVAAIGLDEQEAAMLRSIIG